MILFWRYKLNFQVTYNLKNEGLRPDTHLKGLAMASCQHGNTHALFLHIKR